MTNGSAVQLQKITATGLDRFVDVVCISEVEGHHKPDVRLLEIAAERARETFDGAWLVGDDPERDIGAAAAAGIGSVWLHRGRSWPLDECKPTAEADCFALAVEVVIGGHAP